MQKKRAPPIGPMNLFVASPSDNTLPDFTNYESCRQIFAFLVGSNNDDQNKDCGEKLSFSSRFMEHFTRFSALKGA